MSIRQRIDDAKHLLANGRPEGALLSACAAISATSRKRYPNRKTMSDREAFIRFVGEEMLILTAGMGLHITVQCNGADMKKYQEGMMPLQDILYDFVRCTLAHEGRIGRQIEFDEEDVFSIAVNDGNIRLGGALLRRLFVIPQFAPENSEEFPEVAVLSSERVSILLFGTPPHGHRVPYMQERERRVGSLPHADRL